MKKLLFSKKVAISALLMLMMVFCSGCSMINSAISNLASNSSNSSTSSASKYYTDQLGTALKTYFFDYTVESVESAREYDGYTAEGGNKLVLITTKVKNTFGEELPMFDTDFQIQWGAGDEDYAWNLDSFNDEMMPYSISLPASTTAEYFLVYEVPESITDFTFVYLEEFDDDSTGEFYEIAFTVK